MSQASSVPPTNSERSTGLDPLVTEVRHERERYAASFNYDLQAIFRDLKRQEIESDRTFVSYRSTAPQSFDEVVIALRQAAQPLPEDMKEAALKAIDSLEKHFQSPERRFGILVKQAVQLASITSGWQSSALAEVDAKSVLTSFADQVRQLERYLGIASGVPAAYSAF